MNKQEQIKRITKIIANNRCFDKDCPKCKFNKMPSQTCMDTYLATKLVNAGYGNMKAFFQDLYEKIDAADCQITIDVNDIQKIAKKYGYKIGE